MTFPQLLLTASLLPTLTGSQFSRIVYNSYPGYSSTPAQIAFRIPYTNTGRNGLFIGNRELTKDEAVRYQKSIISKSTPTGRRIVY